MPARVVRSLKMALHAATNKASAIVQQTQVIPASEQLITLLLHVSILLASFGTGCRGFGTAGRSFFYSDFVYLLWFDECFFCLQPLVKINSPSFASGHTLWAFIQAFTWSEVVPEMQSKFIALAEEIRLSREIMGIHYPSDNEASRQVAYKMLQYYFQNDSFHKDLTDAIHEWKTNSPKFVK